MKKVVVMLEFLPQQHNYYTQHKNYSGPGHAPCNQHRVKARKQGRLTSKVPGGAEVCIDK